MIRDFELTCTIFNMSSMSLSMEQYQQNLSKTGLVVKY